MRLYSGSAKEFIEDTNKNQISEKLSLAFEKYYLRRVGPAELNSWINSLQFVKNAIEMNALDDTALILEYELPYTNERIDCILFGKGAQDDENVVVMELKQWSSVESCDIDDNVITFVGGAKRMVPHPALQVRGYHFFLKDFMQIFEEASSCRLSSCVYCHNYSKKKDQALFAPRFEEFIKDFPVFTKDDYQVLGEYLKKRLINGKGLELFNRFITSNIKPSRRLVDCAKDMINGQSAFTLIDEQIAANNTIIDRAKKCSKLKIKSVVIVKGGPGTGKSVIALNALTELLTKGLTVFHATGSAAFTTTLREIAGARARNLFKYFLNFPETRVRENEIDVLICDEAHRIRTSGNSWRTRREYRSQLPQVETLIRAAKVSIFFIDDYQRVKPDEIGSSSLIIETAKRLGAEIYDFELKTQFRCSGSDGFLNWVDNTLQIRETANQVLTEEEKMEFRIFGSPQDLYEEIKRKNAEKPNSARLVAGFCWPWSDAKPDGTLEKDVVIGDFKMTWEAKNDSKNLAPGIPIAALWAYDPNGVNQVGSIYTIQGFEFDYVGVIFGQDLIYNFQKLYWEGHPENSADKAVRSSADKFTELVKNTYRVLLSRGMKGCYVYFMNKDTERFFKSRIETRKDIGKEKELKFSDVIKEEPVTLAQILSDVREEDKFKEYLPVYSLAAAAGKFGENMDVQEEGWFKVNIARKLNKKMFIAKVVGHSMEPLIPDNSYCIFSSDVVGSRQGKIILVQHHSIHDPETGGSYTVKKYTSKKKISSDETWEHEEIVLLPLNKSYEPIIIPPEQAENFKVIAELIDVIREEKKQGRF